MNESLIGSAMFLVCSMLLSAGFLVIVTAIVAINNIFSRYWKPLNWFSFVDTRPQYIVPDFDHIEVDTKETVYKTKTKETTK